MERLPQLGVLAHAVAVLSEVLEHAEAAARHDTLMTEWRAPFFFHGPRDTSGVRVLNSFVFFGHYACHEKARDDSIRARSLEGRDEGANKRRNHAGHDAGRLETNQVRGARIIK